MSQHRATKTRPPRLSDGKRHPVVTRVALWTEIAFANTCAYGCKIYARTDKPAVTKEMHSKVYGCDRPDAT